MYVAKLHILMIKKNPITTTTTTTTLEKQKKYVTVHPGSLNRSLDPKFLNPSSLNGSP